jgi:hypothetical protein
MFNWFDDKINQWFDKRKKDHETRLKVKLNECCDELEGLCTQALNEAKEDLAEVMIRLLKESLRSNRDNGDNFVFYDKNSTIERKQDMMQKLRTKPMV